MSCVMCHFVCHVYVSRLFSDEDEEAELRRELDKIKKEREEERLRKV